MTAPSVTPLPHVLILGAGAAGAAAARVLAAHDQDIRVTLVGQTGETPYTRMLIKNVAFGTIHPERIRLHLPEVAFIADTALAVDAVAREVRLASGARISYDVLIIATGSQARRLPEDATDDVSARTPVSDVSPGSGRVVSLHSVEDALRIRELLGGETRAEAARPARVAIYGGGIIAAETASTLQADGHTVTLIARSSVPGAAAFGMPVAERLAAEHHAHVHTRFGRAVRHITVADRAVAVTLDDDSTVTADLLLLALGTIPHAPEPWHGGVSVDAELRADAPHVYAAGGVAVHRDTALGTWRIDHWEDAAAQGAHAAQQALHDLGIGDDPGTYLPRSPYLAMAYGHMIAGVGTTAGTEAHVDEGDEFVVRHDRGGVTVGVTGIDAVGTVYGSGAELHRSSSGE